MTGVAVCRHRLELAGRATLVAGVAIYRGVGAHQGKAVIVLLYLASGDLPSANRVALLAVCSQLALVNVGMAVLTALSDVGEYRLDVTLRTRDGRMHAPQGIFRLVMIEFRNGADGLPRIRRVTVLARHVEIPVRAVCAPRGLCPDYSGASGKHYEKQ